MNTYEVKVKKLGGDVILAENKKQALQLWLKRYGEEYLEVQE